jgi:hypothetical protein
MKVYIVTRGEYSDYGISKVFLDKEKAKKYVELSQHHWDTPRLEIYETYDDKIINKITYVDARYSKGNKNIEDELDVEIKTTNSIDDTEETVNSVDFWHFRTSGEKELNIQRVLNNEYDEETIIKKYEKACYDMMAKIESLIQLEDWTEEMVELWVKNNLENYTK